MINAHQALNKELYISLLKSLRHWTMEHHPFVQFYHQLEQLLPDQLIL